jgi:hypothetical protein
MAGEICAVLSQPGLQAAMGRQGRKYALERSWEHIFDGLIRDYEEVTGRRHAKTGSGIFTA